MEKATIKETLDRTAAADLWRHTLSQVPSVFGRLVYLTSLRDPNTGDYQHHGFALMFGEDLSNLTLRRSHLKSFSEWLCFTLEQQKADLDLYLSALETDKKTIVEAWLRLTPYRNLVPAEARPVERELFLSDLETLLRLLRNEYGIPFPHPDA